MIMTIAMGWHSFGCRFDCGGSRSHVVYTDQVNNTDYLVIMTPITWWEVYILSSNVMLEASKNGQTSGFEPLWQRSNCDGYTTGSEHLQNRSSCRVIVVAVDSTHQNRFTDARGWRRLARVRRVTVAEIAERVHARSLVRTCSTTPVHCWKHQQWPAEHQNWTTDQWKNSSEFTSLREKIRVRSTKIKSGCCAAHHIHFNTADVSSRIIFLFLLYFLKGLFVLVM